MKRKVTVLGAGSMGTAVSILLSKNGHKVKMWTPFKEEAQMINETRQQKEKLPGALIPGDICCTHVLHEALPGSSVIVIAVPSQAVRNTARQMRDYVNGKTAIIACVSKGLEQDTGLRLSQVIEQELPDVAPVALSGPCHAEELVREMPTAYVAASGSEENARIVQDVFMSPMFRVYTNPDIMGVELGGALKNVIAICSGISDGLGFGDNTRAALMTRGLAEIVRLGVSLGAKGETFSGLAGTGDIIVTCTSEHSRNRRAGILIGKGKSTGEALAEIKMVVEGVYTAKAACMLADKTGVDIPIIRQAYQVLFNNKPPRDAVLELMTREKKDEIYY